MKKINDSKVYLIFSAFMLLVAVVSFSVSMYSVKVVEPRAAAFIEAGVKAAGGKSSLMLTPSEQQEINKNYRGAYEILKKGQLFALYQYFDDKSLRVKKFLSKLDEIYSKNENFPADYDVYLNALLDRRKSGSHMGMNSAAFFLGFALLGFAFLAVERFRRK